MSALGDWFRLRFGPGSAFPKPVEGGPVIAFQDAYALIVGVGADLPGTINDAQGLRDVLVDPRRCGYLSEHVRLLTGADANRANIVSGMEWLSKQAASAATAIVYFSGHGVRQTVEGAWRDDLMPNGYSLADLEGTALDGEAFERLLAPISTRKLLLLLDCCHAGGFELAKAAGIEKAPLPAASETVFGAGKGRFLIASSRASEVSLAGKPYSAFTLALLEALCGAGASTPDGYVRAADLTQYIHATVTHRTKNRQHPMTDFVGADNFAVSYYAGGDPQVKAPLFAQTQIEDERGQFASAPGTAFYQQGWIVQNVQNIGPTSGPVTINIDQRRHGDDAHRS